MEFISAEEALARSLSVPNEEFIRKIKSVMNEEIGLMIKRTENRILEVSGNGGTSCVAYFGTCSFNVFGHAIRQLIEREVAPEIMRAFAKNMPPGYDTQPEHTIMHIYWGSASLPDLSSVNENTLCDVGCETTDSISHLIDKR